MSRIRSLVICITFAALALPTATQAATCSPFQPAGTADITLSDATCKRFSPGTGRLNIDNAALSTGRFVARVRTGVGVGVWVCKPAHPSGWDSPTLAPWSPCWQINDTGYVYRRVRGDKSATYPFPYIGSDRDATLVDGTHGYSVVIQGGSGNLISNPSTCPAMAAYGNTDYTSRFTWTFTGRLSDDGNKEWVAVPITGGTPVSGPWATGGFGSPCPAHGGDGDYATITYQDDSALY